MGETTTWKKVNKILQQDLLTRFDQGYVTRNGFIGFNPNKQEVLKCWFDVTWSANVRLIRLTLDSEAGPNMLH